MIFFYILRIFSIFLFEFYIFFFIDILKHSSCMKRFFYLSYFLSRGLTVSTYKSNYSGNEISNKSVPINWCLIYLDINISPLQIVVSSVCFYRFCLLFFWKRKVIHEIEFYYTKIKLFFGC